MSDQVENDDDLLLDTVEEDDVSDIDLDSDDEQLDDDGQPDDSEDDDTEELEHDGQKYKIPKALKPLVLMQADYTQKTQALAEQRKAFEAETAQKQAHFQQNVNEIARIVNIDQRLNQFQNLNWQAVSENDPLQAQQLMIERQQLMEQRQQIVLTISQREQQQQAFTQQQQHELLVKGNEQLAKEIPNWGADMARQVMTFSKNQLGFSDQELNGISDPRVVKLLHAAMIGVGKQKAIVAKKPATQPVPVKTVGKSGSPANKNPERMSTDDFMKFRNQQLRKNKR